MNPTPPRLHDALSDRYRIERALGTGGMATVYLAEDLKHDRKVAIKVLKPELAAVLGAERFVQEIKTTASLSHPHILPLFDSGTADGFLYYVMPYIAGETIRDRLNRETQFGVEDAVRITREVADALDYAHRHGVIHRDIKPENILLHDRRALVMDFGIALAVSAAAGGRMTETGLSLGTPHYMSPEQATADKDITARSDVYSLASVLYEMLGGEPPHMGNSAQQIIMKIIAEPVQPVTALRKSVPPNVAAALAKALEKLPADRFPDAAGFATALGDRSFVTDTATGVAGQAPGSSWRQRLTVPALVVLALAVAANVYQGTRPAPVAQVKRYEVRLEGLDQTEAFRSMALSPDGARMVYVKAIAGGSRLAARGVDQLEGRELGGTDNAINPFFSPDGKQVGFMVAANAIKVVGFEGGPAITVADSGVGTPGATWSPDGHIYFDALGSGPLLRVRASGGTRPEPATQLDTTAGEQQHVWPEALPNDRGLLFVVNHTGPGRQGVDTDRIAVLDLRTGRHRVLFPGVYARYAASGHLLYVTHDGTLMAVRFDVDRLTTDGEPIAVAEQVQVGVSGTGAVNLTLSGTGTLWYMAGSPAQRRGSLVWIGTDGQATPVDSSWVEDIASVSLSPDATRAALILRRSDGNHVWVKELRRGGALNKIGFEGVDDLAWWQADGRSLLFQSLRSASNSGIWRIPADGSGTASPVMLTRRMARSGSWSPDGAWFAFQDGSNDILAIRPGTDSVPRAMVKSAAHESEPQLSPDGQWLSYTSERTGRREVYVSPFPGTEQSLTQVSVDGGSGARWARDGRSIVYRTNLGATFVTARVRTVPGFSVESHQSTSVGPGLLQTWDLAADGRILAVRQLGIVGASRHIVVENFLGELKRRVPNN